MCRNSQPCRLNISVQAGLKGGEGASRKEAEWPGTAPVAAAATRSIIWSLMGPTGLVQGQEQERLCAHRVLHVPVEAEGLVPGDTVQERGQRGHELGVRSVCDPDRRLHRQGGRGLTATLSAAMPRLLWEENQVPIPPLDVGLQVSSSFPVYSSLGAPRLPPEEHQHFQLLGQAVRPPGVLNRHGPLGAAERGRRTPHR